MPLSLLRAPQTARPERHRKALVVLLFVVAASISACSSAANVVVATAQTKVISLQPGGLGTTAAAVDIPVTLGFKAQIDSISVVPGQSVTSGQTLMTVTSLSGTSPSDLASLQARLASDRAALAGAQADLAKPDVQSNPALLAAKQAEVEAATSRVGLDQELIGLAQGQAQVIGAPFTGVVGSIGVAAGQSLKVGQTAMDVIDYHHITVTAELPVQYMPDVTVGNTATVAFTTVAGLSLTGTVTAVSPEANNNGESFQVTVDAANTPTLAGRPGLTAFVRVSVHHKATVTVNKLAVLDTTTTPIVFVVSKGIAHEHKVQVGASDGTYDEILSGLNPGDQCVISGAQSLKDGSHVTVTGHQD